MTTDDKIKPIFAWFQQTLSHHADRPALEVEGETFSYRELDHLVQHVAATLRPRGVLPGARVGLLVERSAMSFATYLAIQRLGATAVPLNVLFPAARVAAIAENAGLALIVVVNPEYRDLHPSAILLDRDEVQAANPDDAGPAYEAAADSIAYILFTSGSTGVPKGVAVSQRNVDAYTRHIVARYEVTPESRLSQTFDLTFDPSVFDMMGAWASGAALVVPSRGDLLAPARFVQRTQISHWFSVPSIVSLADRLRGLGPGSMPSLKWSLFAGEPLTLVQASAWQRAASNSTIENIYGPTELTVTCTEFRLSRDTSNWPVTSNGTVPIGEPYPLMEARVIDEYGQPSDEGELCMRGPQRFVGYLNEIDNAGRFLTEDLNGSLVGAKTHTPAPSHLWYRTGDRVRRTQSGLLHLGRLDNQLKLRGYRVELGDIEAQLLSMPETRDAVVLVVTATDGDKELVAVRTGDPLSEDVALDRLAENLPSYMVPRRVLHRDEMPLNLNGKIDRSALAREWEAGEAA